jgi:hypothetical protein
LSGLGCGEMLAVMARGLILPTRCEISSSPTSLRALGRRSLHSPRARGLHSHSLGSCAGGGWWQRAGIFYLSCSSRGDNGWRSNISTAVAATTGNEKP